MRLLLFLASLMALAQLPGCAPARHDTQAAPRVRRVYQHAQRQHTRARHRRVPLYLPWN